MVYDGDGNRVQQTVNGQTTSYLVDDRNPTGYAQVVEEIVNGVVNHTYTYGHDLISQDQVDPATNSGHATFYAYDGHGNVRFLTNESGQVTDNYVYDAFGTLITATGTTNNRYLYTGEQFDLYGVVHQIDLRQRCRGSDSAPCPGRYSEARL